MKIEDKNLTGEELAWDIWLSRPILTLEINYCNIMWDFECLNLPNLTRLELKSSSISSEFLQDIIEAACSLNTMIIEDCTGLTLFTDDYIDGLKDLSTLHIRYCDMPAVGVGNLILLAEFLQVAQIWGGYAMSEILHGTYSSSLASLQLVGLQININDIAKIFTVFPKLVSLELTDCLYDRTEKLETQWQPINILQYMMINNTAIDRDLIVLVLKGNPKLLEKDVVVNNGSAKRLKMS